MRFQCSADIILASAIREAWIADCCAFNGHNCPKSKCVARKNRPAMKETQQPIAKEVAHFGSLPFVRPVSSKRTKAHQRGPAGASLAAKSCFHQLFAQTSILKHLRHFRLVSRHMSRIPRDALGHVGSTVAPLNPFQRATKKFLTGLGRLAAGSIFILLQPFALR